MKEKLKHSLVQQQLNLFKMRDLTENLSSVDINH